MDGEGRLTRAFRAIDFDHATFWVALNAQRQVRRQRSGWDGFDFFNGFVAELHNSAFAVGLVHAVQGQLECFEFVLLQTFFRVLSEGILTYIVMNLRSGVFFVNEVPTFAVGLGLQAESGEDFSGVVLGPVSK